MYKMRFPCGVSISGLVFSVLAALLPVANAQADSLASFENLSQDQFRAIARNLSAATHYKSIAPAENLGTLGFDIGLEVSSTDIDGSLFDQASDGDFSGSELIIPRVHVHKGLPFGLDLGASLSRVPDTELTILGGELRYSFVSGNVITPAIGVRATYSVVEGASDFDMNSAGLELTVSKGFLLVTPYAGIGIVRSTADPKNIAGLSSDTYEQNKYYAGATLNFGIALTAEIERTEDFRTYSVKAGIRF
jgi:hypothetical protein